MKHNTSPPLNARRIAIRGHPVRETLAELMERFHLPPSDQQYLWHLLSFVRPDLQRRACEISLKLCPTGVEDIFRAVFYRFDEQDASCWPLYRNGFKNFFLLLAPLIGEASLNRFRILVESLPHDPRSMVVGIELRGAPAPTVKIYHWIGSLSPASRLGFVQQASRIFACGSLDPSWLRPADLAVLGIGFPPEAPEVLKLYDRVSPIRLTELATRPLPGIRQTCEEFEKLVRALGDGPEQVFIGYRLSSKMGVSVKLDAILNRALSLKELVAITKRLECLPNADSLLYRIEPISRDDRVRVKAISLHGHVVRLYLVLS